MLSDRLCLTVSHLRQLMGWGGRSCRSCWTAEWRWCCRNGTTALKTCLKAGLRDQSYVHDVRSLMQLDEISRLWSYWRLPTLSHFRVHHFQMPKADSIGQGVIYFSWHLDASIPYEEDWEGETDVREGENWGTSYKEKEGGMRSRLKGQFMNMLKYL